MRPRRVRLQSMPVHCARAQLPHLRSTRAAAAALGCGGSGAGQARVFARTRAGPKMRMLRRRRQQMSAGGARGGARTGRSPSARAAPSARPPRASAAPRLAAPTVPTTACAPAPRSPAGATALRASGTRGTLPSCCSLTHGSAAVTRRREARARTSRCAVGLAPAAGTRMIFTAASVLVALCTAWTTTA